MGPTAQARLLSSIHKFESDVMCFLNTIDSSEKSNILLNAPGLCLEQSRKFQYRLFRQSLLYMSGRRFSNHCLHTTTLQPIALEFEF